MRAAMTGFSALSLLLSLVVADGALTHRAAAGIEGALTRRAAFTGALTAAIAAAAPRAASANIVDATGMLDTYKQNPGLGLEAANAPPGSVPFVEVLKGMKDKKVEGVIFFPPMGDEAYAILDGKSVRIGQGWPVEVSNTYQSPRIVMPVLETEGVPYAVCAQCLTVASCQSRVRSQS